MQRPQPVKGALVQKCRASRARSRYTSTSSACATNLDASVSSARATARRRVSNGGGASNPMEVRK